MNKVFLYNPKTGLLMNYSEAVEIYNRDFVRVNQEEHDMLFKGATWQDVLNSRSDFLKQKEALVVAANARRLRQEKKESKELRDEFSVDIEIDAKSANNMEYAREKLEAEGLGERPFSDIDFDTVTVDYLNNVKDEDLVTFGKYVLNVGGEPIGDKMTGEARQAHYNRLRADFTKMIAKLERKRRE